MNLVSAYLQKFVPYEKINPGQTIHLTEFLSEDFVPWKEKTLQILRFFMRRIVLLLPNYEKSCLSLLEELQ
jgi:hypothetical protein